MGRFLRTVVGLERVHRVSPVALVALATLLTAAGAAASPLKVDSSTLQAVRFSVDGLEPTWHDQIVRDGALTLSELSLPGFVSSAPVGSPRVPGRGAWLIVPPGTHAEVRTIREDWTPLAGRRLAVEPTPVIQRGGEAHDTGVSELLLLPGETPPAGLEIPAAARAELAAGNTKSAPAGVSLGTVGWWRGHRVVPVRITAAKVDATGMARAVLRGGQWEVRFVPDKAADAAQVPSGQQRRLTDTSDRRFSGTFLNGDILGSVPTEAAYHGILPAAEDKALAARGDKRGTPLGFESRLAVTRTRLQRVTYTSLRSRGLLPDVPIQENEIRLYQRRYLAAVDDGTGAPYIEVEVPIHMFGEGDAFDGDDYFVFYGLRLRDDVSYSADLGDGVITVPGCGDPFEQNNEANFYWLAASAPDIGEAWARMESISLPAAGGTLVDHYRRVEHIEEQVAFRENLPNVAADRLYYNGRTARDVTVPINPLYPPAATPTLAPELKVALAGFNTVTRNLKLDLLTDDTIVHLENYGLASTSEVVRTYALQPSALLGTSARVSMTTNPEGGIMFSFLNWVELSYDAQFVAVNNKLEFNAGNGTGARPIEVTGFADADLALFEITDPRRPRFVALSAANIVADGTGAKLSIMPDQGAGEVRRFSAAADAGGTGIDEYVTFRSAAALDATDPTGTGGSNPDLLVITHADFRGALDRWVAHRVARAGGDLQVHVVDIQDVFDTYSGGLRDAWAIKRFANHALDRWGTWALVIVGDANENVLGKQVLPQAREWSTDWVPTHYHVQRASGYAPELMASDKWYTAREAGADYPNDNFPYDVTGPWDMYTGRFPCNSVGELENMIDKVITVETLADGQDWRRRGIFIGDDEWSNGLGVLAQSELTYHIGETVFGLSEREELAAGWAGLAAVPLDSQVILLKPYMDAGFPYELPNPAPRDLGDARAYCAATAVDPLIAKFNLGGIVAHFQGHANPYLLSSEVWLEDRRSSPGRRDIDRLANTGRPWLFMGLGCHIADWAQNAVRSDVVPNEASIAEKMLTRGGSGASAIYASSGFEYITANRDFGRYIFNRFVSEPPLAGAVRGAADGRSRWMSGELLWAAEADVRANSPFQLYLEMISQYVLLGDPLMILDAGPPVVTATLVGDPDQEISGEVDLAALDATNLRTVQVAARDEAGIDRLQVIDSTGADLTDLYVTETLPDGATNHRIVDYTLELPIRPFDHSLTVRVFDTGGPLPGDRHWDLVLNMPQTATFVAAGEVVDPDTWVFQAGESVAMSAQVASSAQLNDTMVLSLTSGTLELSDVTFDFLNKGRELDVDFTATVGVTDPDASHSVVLTIDGLPTELVVQAGTTAAVVEGIGRVYNYPNPMRDDTRFVFESGASGGAGVIRVFSVAGRTVAKLPFDYDGAGRGIVNWNGRDGAGDELANGTYLYRIEMDAPGGRVVSDMQRLVVMR